MIQYPTLTKPRHANKFTKLSSGQLSKPVEECPSHSTHSLQSLNIGLFDPLQHAYSEKVHLWTRDCYEVIRKESFWIGGNWNLCT